MILPCARRGNRPLTYPDTLVRDKDLVLNELAQANKPLWCDIVPAISTQSIDDDDDDDDDDDIRIVLCYHTRLILTLGQFKFIL